MVSGEGDRLADALGVNDGNDGKGGPQSRFRSPYLFKIDCMHAAARYADPQE
jgi:hypothetical protein